jgi:hypothetical protein
MDPDVSAPVSTGFRGYAFAAVDFLKWPPPARAHAGLFSNAHGAAPCRLDHRVKEITLRCIGLITLIPTTMKRQAAPAQSEAEVIDSFILEVGKWARRAREAGPEVGVPVTALNSVEEDEDLATETLARLYARQGRRDKAKSVYKKLMLRFPEKHSYFASQIENLDLV